ncbi:hypothetical protein [Vibrio bivalvicida]|uniref:Uncharacterized protein n=1 Tax=Vibrio bivalvicida TaxID=1276888 RepID=A0ABV4MDG0_9VIBR
MCQENGEFKLPFGVTVKKSTDLGALTSFIFSLISLSVSATVAFIAIFDRYELDAYLTNSNIIFEFSDISEEGRLNIKSPISELTAKTVVVNTGKKSASILSISLDVELNGDVYSFFWNDTIKAGQGTDKPTMHEVQPFVVKGGEVQGDTYRFTLAKTNGSEPSRNANFGDIVQHFDKRNANVSLPIRLIYQLADGNQIKHSCFIPLKLPNDSLNRDLNGMFRARNEGLKADKHRSDGSYGMTCYTLSSL